MKYKKYGGGQKRQQRLISEKAIYALRNEVPDVVAKYTKQQLADIVHEYAVTFNKRLARIEKAGLTESSAAYRYIEKASYSGFDFVTSKNRFRTTKNQTYEDLVEELYQLHQFGRSKSSTVSGIREINYNKVSKAYEALEKDEHRGLKEKMENWINKEKEAGKTFKEAEDELAAFFNSDIISKIIKMYGSDAIDIIMDELGGRLGLSDGAILDLVDEFITIKGIDSEHFNADEYPLLNFIDDIETFYNENKMSNTEDFTNEFTY